VTAAGKAFAALAAAILAMFLAFKCYVSTLPTREQQFRAGDGC
jgi:hypothetical protein